MSKEITWLQDTSTDLTSLSSVIQWTLIWFRPRPRPALPHVGKVQVVLPHGLVGSWVDVGRIGSREYLGLFRYYISWPYGLRVDPLREVFLVE